MKISGAAAPLAVLRSILLQQAALRSPDKSRSHTTRGPGIMPYYRTQQAKRYYVKGMRSKTYEAVVPRLARAEGPYSLDHDTERRRQQWLKKHLSSI